MALLEVESLRVEFNRRRGILKAVDDVSLKRESFYTRARSFDFWPAAVVWG